MSDGRIAAVTGANRGIGFEVAGRLAEEGVTVILTARDEVKGKNAAEKLKGERADVRFHQLEVTDEGSIKNFYGFVATQFGRLDILVNNAGILLDREVSGLDVDLDTVRRTLETNVNGPLALCQVFIPLMMTNGYGRIVNISSGMGRLSTMSGGYPAYRISKAAVNAVTRILANEVSGSNILINSVDPGWVRTDMGGPGAFRTPEAAADTIIWLATLPDGGPTGGFFHDRKPVDW